MSEEACSTNGTIAAVVETKDKRLLIMLWRIYAMQEP
jgi:hypothetical protein